MNFAFRGACNRCGTARPAGAAGISGAGGRGKGRAAGQESGGVGRPVGGGLFGPNDWPCPMYDCVALALCAFSFVSDFLIITFCFTLLLTFKFIILVVPHTLFL